MPQFPQKQSEGLIISSLQLGYRVLGSRNYSWTLCPSDMGPVQLDASFCCLFYQSLYLRPSGDSNMEDVCASREPHYYHGVGLVLH